MPLEPLKFKVAPHIVEDLGFNLYTSLPRVLVEFIANAYDADAASIRISLDKTKIDAAREVMHKEYELECAKAKESGSQQPILRLAKRTLPPEIKIVIEDDGHGMSRDDLDKKFLVAGRRRRQEEPLAAGRSPKQRPLMGRKGVGKLAGFGIAKFVEVTTRKEGEVFATEIRLDYDDLVKKRDTHEIVVQEKHLPDGGGLKEKGTRIVLSGLLFDPVKSRPQTIESEIADHFAMIDPTEFEIHLNEKPIVPVVPAFAFAWPEPDKDRAAFVERELPNSVDPGAKFRYRIRFMGKKEALPAARRGIRVYVRRRMAAAPSLLDADTNMHGFRMTDYLDGVVHADFIDETDTDYIATDRQSLRWDAPLLEPLNKLLSAEIKEACKQYQAVRDEVALKEVKEDPFTKKEIEKYDFSKKDQRLAMRFASILEGACKRGVSDPIYQTKLPVLMKGIGHGNILIAISELADEATPNLSAVAVEIARLTKDEMGQFISTARARLKGIKAFKKVVEAQDFKKKNEEKTVQKMFEESPWLINPTFSQFLSANQSIDTLFARLAKALKIGEHAPVKKKGKKGVASDGSNDSKRPDLVFLIGSESLGRLVIVELKAINVALEQEHLSQLYYYMETAEAWLKEKGHDIKVEGQLIGTMADPNSKAEGVVALRRSIKVRGQDATWMARDFTKVLKETEAAHKELIEIYEKAEKAIDAEPGN